MKVVDGRRMLLNGQAQDSSGFNINPFEVEAEVCAQSVLDFVESFRNASILCFSFTLRSHISYFAIISFIRIKSLP